MAGGDWIGRLETRSERGARRGSLLITASCACKTMVGDGE